METCTIGLEQYFVHSGQFADFDRHWLMVCSSAAIDSANLLRQHSQYIILRLLTVVSQSKMNVSFHIRRRSSIHHATSDKIDAGRTTWGSLVHCGFLIHGLDLWSVA